MPMVETVCDGMPSMAGCGNLIETSVPYKNPGTKKSGWYLTWGVDYETNEKTDILLAFCPSCAVIVKEQEARQ